jgi:Ca-activated chloride channel family protein
VDVVVALDVSRSMLAQDVKPSRLERARFQIAELSERLRSDRMGLVLFAGQALVQCPLTLDHSALRTYLNQADPTAVPVPGTALAEAIRLADRSYPEGSHQYKALILFTDGENFQEDPLAAARQAADRGVRIFAVGLGTPEGDLIPEGGADGRGFHQDARGNYVKTRLAEETLQKIALTGDGAYYRSSVGGTEIGAIAEQIGHLDQRDLGTARLVQQEERFQIPLLLALACFAAEAWLSERRRGRREWQGRFA